MRDSFLKLREKTVILSGAFTSITQSIMTVLTEQGADVAYVDEQAEKAKRFVDNINDHRSVHEHLGQAIALTVNFTDPESIKDIPGQVAEYLGSVDVLIDALPLQLGFANSKHKSIKATNELSQSVLKFLEGRGKGRVLYLTYKHNMHQENQPKNFESLQKELFQMVKTQGQNLIQKNITMNCLNLGPTEDFFLNYSPKKSSVKDALKDFQGNFPKAKLIDSLEVANCVGFICSSISQAVNGQVIEVDQGLI